MVVSEVVFPQRVHAHGLPDEPAPISTFLQLDDKRISHLYSKHFLFCLPAQQIDTAVRLLYAAALEVDILSNRKPQICYGASCACQSITACGIACTKEKPTDSCSRACIRQDPCP